METSEAEVSEAEVVVQLSKERKQAIGMTCAIKRYAVHDSILTIGLLRARFNVIDRGHPQITGCNPLRQKPSPAAFRVKTIRTNGPIIADDGPILIEYGVVEEYWWSGSQ